jgi:Adenylate and Guanylate cyclase catalytic domain/zinc-ribbon domain
VDDSSRGALTVTGLLCGSCGTELPPNSMFCNECGAPVTQLSRSAEYRQVTVLFADVVHSMDIAAAVGAERLREVMMKLADRATAVVQHFGGTVAQFTGDGVMAVFGAPVALEDHAIRACLAALGVQDEAKRADVAEAEAVIERLAAAPADDRLVIREIWLLRLRALLAQTRGATAHYRDLVERYRTMATSLGCEGHVAWAEAMK